MKHTDQKNFLLRRIFYIHIRYLGEHLKFWDVVKTINSIFSQEIYVNSFLKYVNIFHLSLCQNIWNSLSINYFQKFLLTGWILLKTVSRSLWCRRRRCIYWFFSFIKSLYPKAVLTILLINSIIVHLIYRQTIIFFSIQIKLWDDHHDGCDL